MYHLKFTLDGHGPCDFCSYILYHCYPVVPTIFLFPLTSIQALAPVCVWPTECRAKLVIHALFMYQGGNKRPRAGVFWSKIFVFALVPYCAFATFSFCWNPDALSAYKFYSFIICDCSSLARNAQSIRLPSFTPAYTSLYTTRNDRTPTQTE